MIFRNARASGSRIEHLVAPGETVTRCGKDARPMAKFTNAERGQDSKIRPVCGACRATV